MHHTAKVCDKYVQSFSLALQQLHGFSEHTAQPPIQTQTSILQNCFGHDLIAWSGQKHSNFLGTNGTFSEFSANTRHLLCLQMQSPEFSVQGYDLILLSAILLDLLSRQCELFNIISPIKFKLDQFLVKYCHFYPSKYCHCYPCATTV